MVFAPTLDVDALVAEQEAQAVSGGGSAAAAAPSRGVRQKRNPSEPSELASVRGLLQEVVAGAHEGLSEVFRDHTLVGMVRCRAAGGGASPFVEYVPIAVHSVPYTPAIYM